MEYRLQPDHELLRQFVESRSEEAFQALVERYSGLVYSSCIRRLREHHRAEDAGQAVFIILARKASTLGAGTVLADWLFQTSQYVVTNMMRSTVRRAKLEAKVASMRSPHPDDAEQSENAEVWAHVKPRLDQALNNLSAPNRRALILRYLAGRSHADVARELGCSEDAARKRIAYALEKLRGRLGTEATLSIALLAGILETHASEPAQHALTHTFLSAALGKTTANASMWNAGLIANETIRSMFWVTVRSRAIVATLVIGIAGAALMAASESTWHASTPQTSPPDSATSKAPEEKSSGTATHADELNKIVAGIRQMLPEKEYRTIVAGPLILTSDASQNETDKLNKELQEALAGIRGKIVQSNADWPPILVFALKDQNSYIRATVKLFDRKPRWPYGDVVAAKRSVIFNIETGTGLEGVIAAMIGEDNPACPECVRWGLARLYGDGKVAADGNLVGVTNWEVTYLFDGQVNGREPALATLLRLPDKVYHARYLETPKARYLLQWLQEQGKLKTFYSRIRDKADTDAVASLEKVFDGKPIDKIESQYRAWIEIQAKQIANSADVDSAIRERIAHEEPLAQLVPLQEIDRQQLDRMEREAQRTLPPNFRILRTGSWILASELSEDRTQKIASNIFGVAPAKLQRQFFNRRAAWSPIVYYLFKSPASYATWSQQIFDGPALPIQTEVNYPERHAVAVNMSVSDGAILYCMVSDMCRMDLYGAPPWLEQGLGLLFEDCMLNPYGDIVGQRRARLDDLLGDFKSGHLPSLKDVLTEVDGSYDRPKPPFSNLIAARFLLLWLQEQGKLEDFYHRVRDQFDATPSQSLCAVFDNKLSIDQIDEKFRSWVSTLEKEKSK